MNTLCSPRVIINILLRKHFAWCSIFMKNQNVNWNYNLGIKNCMTDTDVISTLICKYIAMEPTFWTRMNDKVMTCVFRCFDSLAVVGYEGWRWGRCILTTNIGHILDWPESSFEFFCIILQDEPFGQLSIYRAKKLRNSQHLPKPPKQCNFLLCISILDVVQCLFKWLKLITCLIENMTSLAWTNTHRASKEPGLLVLNSNSVLCTWFWDRITVVQLWHSWWRIWKRKMLIQDWLLPLLNFYSSCIPHTTFY